MIYFYDISHLSRTSLVPTSAREDIFGFSEAETRPEFCCTHFDVNQSEEGRQGLCTVDDCRSYSSHCTNACLDKLPWETTGTCHKIVAFLCSSLNSTSKISSIWRNFSITVKFRSDSSPSELVKCARVSGPSDPAMVCCTEDSHESQHP